MLKLLIGSLIVLIDIDNKHIDTVSRSSGDGKSVAQLRGWQFDLVPDEIGYFMVALAFFGLATLAQGSLKAWLKALGTWQWVMIVATIVGHRVDQEAVTLVTEYGSQTTTLPASPLGYLTVLLQSPLQAFAGLVTGWCLVKLCQSLDLVRGAQLWTRYAWLLTFVAVVHMGGLLYVLFRYLSEPDGSLFGFLPLLAQSFVVFAVVVVGVAIAMGILWVHACLGTRAEAREVAAHSDSPATFE